MPLDFSPLTATSLSIALVSFILTFAITQQWTLFRVPHRRAYYAGLVPLGVVSIVSVFVLEDIALRLGLIVAALLIAIIGRADELHPLSAAAQLFWQMLIAIVLVTFGWSITHVSHPFSSGVLTLGVFGFPLAVGWIVGMMNAVNWFDGLDGLASSIGVIAFLTLAAISLLPATQDSTTLNLALIGAGSLGAFWVLNAPPARVFLGTSGSWFLGSFLAVTAIVGGGKVATAVLVLALPLLDVLFVVIQRVVHGQRPWIGDTKHHMFHRLAAAGLNPWQIIALLAFVTALLGASAVRLQTAHKLITLGGVSLVAAVAVIFLAYVSRRRHSSRR